LGIRELTRGRQLDVEAPFLDREEAVELARDLLDLTTAPFLRDETQEIAHELVRAAEQLVEHRHLRARLELRVAQHGAQLRHVAASIWRFVSSSRRWRSASVSSFTRWRCESATRRASARISSACPRAWPMSARCSSISFRASLRARSASSSARLIRSRRSSIA